VKIAVAGFNEFRNTVRIGAMTQSKKIKTTT
jgi:hypothetical protein